MANTGKRKKLGAVYLVSAGLIVLTVAGCVLYAQRDQFLIHYHLRAQVSSDAPPAQATAWLIEHKALAVPTLVEEFRQADAERTRRARELVERIMADHPDPTDPEDSHLSLALAARLHEIHASLPPHGRLASVTLSGQVLRKHLAGWSPNAPTALETAGDVLLAGLIDDDLAVKEQALLTVSEIWTWNGADNIANTLVKEWKRHCYERAVRLLGSAAPRIRAAAAAALTHTTFHEGDSALIALLEDPDPNVQKVALVSLATVAADSLNSTQKTRIMDFLHDADAEVRGAAALVLKKSGLSDAKVHLATLMKHPVATERAKVVSLAFSVPDIDPARWVLALADDPSPAVRIAVARAASTSESPELKSRLAAMAESDPDPLVRELAQQFLASQTAKKGR